ncbi:MAG: haloacid dehalogenase type II [Herbaspirillum sp.]
MATYSGTTQAAPIQAVVFDAYGTLFDVYSVKVMAEKLYPGQGATLAALWRDKQIEYTMLRTLCSMYKPFWEVTQDALVYACHKLGLKLDVDAHNALMGQYAKLPAFPENLAVLHQLKAAGLKTAILSNGNPQMLETAITAAGMDGLFNHVLSVDAVSKFKTAPEVYQLAPDMFGLSTKHILFVSSNGWDVCGAAWFGYTTFWVNRQAAPFEELGVMPSAHGVDLRDVATFIQTTNLEHT